MIKKQILMNKPVYRSLSILNKSNTVVHQFLYDGIKSKLMKT